ncbi:hypothetical protein J437_LFUL000376 [Ladona fulva]|uniref:Elongator complex protein 6 n=1 Tax=Ladona fulva TaxID=123851 RepID=A0A8K0K7I4_LADFU|nr:hypothetical protein J437_LFUL000376 [Ladona fulva]
MATDFYLALELDKVDLSGKVISVVERQGGNANFVISALMSHFIDNKTAICLLSLHNTFGHYRNVGMKFGKNLQKLKEEGSFKCIEMLKTIERSVSDRTTEIDFLFPGNQKDMPLKNLFLTIKREAELLLQTQKSVCILVDDLSDLFCLGYSSSQVLSFYQYCRSLIFDLKSCSLVVLCHSTDEDIESMLTVTGICHTSYLSVEVCGLNTGISGDVSGVINIGKRDEANSRIRNTYHFKLEEKRIRVFPPGASPALF